MIQKELSPDVNQVTKNFVEKKEKKDEMLSSDGSLTIPKTIQKKYHDILFG